MDNKVPIRFFTVTFLWSWLFWLPFVLAGAGIIDLGDAGAALRMPVLIIGAFGPAAGAWYSIRTLRGKGAFRRFMKSFTDLRFGWKVWSAIILIPGIINLAAWYLPELAGHERLPMLLPGLYAFPVMWLVMVFLGGGQEEIGWRGYIMPILESRYGLWLGNIILGVVWAVWHIPLWFIPGTSQVYFPFVAFTIGLIGMSFFFSWVIKASGGRPFSGLVVHGTINAFIPLFPTVIMDANAVQWRFWIQQVMILAVGILFMTLLKSYSKTREKK